MLMVLSNLSQESLKTCLLHTTLCIQYVAPRPNSSSACARPSLRMRIPSYILLYVSSMLRRALIRHQLARGLHCVCVSLVIHARAQSTRTYVRTYVYTYCSREFIFPENIGPAMAGRTASAGPVIGRAGASPPSRTSVVRVARYRIASKCFYAFLFRRPRGEKYRNNCVWIREIRAATCLSNTTAERGLYIAVTTDTIFIPLTTV